jgi:GxxExxY protein
MLRVDSRLPEDLEILVTRVIGCCLAVHRALGPGFMEHVVAQAVCIELRVSGLAFECEKPIPITYRGTLLCHHRLDLVVERRVILELKAVERLAPVHHAQVLSYLKASGLRVGLLVNFNAAILQQGLRRIVL